MNMYYTIGEIKSLSYVHFEIKEAYDNQTPTSEWIETHPADKTLIEQIRNQLTFPIATSMQYITRFSSLKNNTDDILNIVKSFNVNLIRNDKLATCLYLPSTLVVRKTPLDIYYHDETDTSDCNSDSSTFDNMWFAFKKYEDNNISTYEAVHDASICKDYNSQLECSQEYKDFLDTLEAFGCVETQECVYELSIPFKILEPFLKQYGYNMIEINQLNVY